VSAEQQRSFVLAVTGLRAEARIAERSENVRAVAGGGDTARLEALIIQAVEDGAGALVSFGIAAGLAPGLAAGTCVVAREVVHEGRSYAAEASWSARIRQAMDVTGLVTIAGVDRPLQSAVEKEALHASTRAAAADMESHIVVRLAAKHSLPFAVLRAIADPAMREIPQAALDGMGSDGRINIGGVLVSLAKDPTMLRSLVRLTADTRLAMGTLLRCHSLLGPGLGFGDLR
jgi:adenosylhomocysteine nucleosidase